MYQVGQILYTIIEDKKIIVPVRIIEEVTIKKIFKLYSTAKEGVEEVKSAINNAYSVFNYDKFQITYKAAGEFGVTIVHEDKKSADKMYNDFIQNLEKEAKSNKLIFSH